MGQRHSDRGTITDGVKPRCHYHINCDSEQLSPDGKIAVASSVTVFAVASIVFFIVGFLCGHFCQKKRKSNTPAADAESVPPLATGGEQKTDPLL